MRKTLLAYQLFIISTLFNVNAIAQTTLTLQPSAAAGKDATISNFAGESTMNYGNNPEFMSQSASVSSAPFARRGLLQFDLSSVPTNATVISAYLSLYAYNLPGTGGHLISYTDDSYLYKVTQAWNESTVTWANQPSYTWSNSVYFPKSDSANQNYINMDVRDLVQDLVTTPANNFGFLFKQNYECNCNQQLVFGSSDNATAALRPKLVVVWAVCSGIPPVAALTPSGTATICYGTSQTFTATAGTGYAYQWYKNGVFVTGGSSNTFSTNTSGNYTVKVTNAPGCTAISSPTTLNVTMENAKITTSTGSSYWGCATGGLTMNATVFPGTSYTWKLNGSTVGSGASYSSATPGIYTCVFTNGTCNYTSNAITSEALSATISTTDPTTFCTGQAYLDIQINGWGSSSQTFQWQNNGSPITGATGYSYSATSTGYYNCKLTDPWCASPVYTNSIGVTTGIAPHLIVTSYTGTNPVNICSNYSVWLQVTDQATGSIFYGDSITTFQWYQDGNMLWGETNNSIYPTASGHYMCEIYTSCGPASTYYPGIEVHSTYFAPAPPIYPSGNAYGCSSVIMTANTVGDLPWVGYQWKFNGNSIPGATNDSLVVNQSGFYSCVFNNGCGTIESAYTNLTMQNDTAYISASVNTVCAGTSVTLSANTNTGISSYQWKLNGANITGATASTYAATTGGNYSCVVIGNCGSFTSNTINLTGLSSPVSVITSPPGYQCATASITISANTGTGYTYEWYKTGSLVTGATQPSLTVNTSGYYYVKITGTNGCFDYSDSIKAIFGSNPIITSYYPSPVCGGTSLNVGNIAGLPYSVQWKLNGVAIPGANAYTYGSAIQSGTYTVDVSNECGTYTAPGFPLVVKPLPPAVVTASGPLGFCPPDSVVLSANTGTGLSYLWNNGATTASVTATTTRGYYVTITDASTGCSSSSNYVSVSATGIVPAITPAISSACGPQVLTANGGAGFTYQWKNSGVNISGATNQSYNVTSTGYYSVAITGSCGTTTTYNTHFRVDNAINPAAVIIYPSATTVCSGQSVLFQINRFVIPPYMDSDSIRWKLNGVQLASGYGTTLYAKATGDYTVTISNSCGSASSAPVHITFNPLPTPVITAGGSVTFCTGSVVLNVATGAGYTYQWKRNNGMITGATSSSYAASVSGTYTCDATSSSGCVGKSNFINVFIGAPGAAISATGATTICGGTVTLNASPSGAGNSFLWKRNGVTIAGATASTFGATTSGAYSCTITNNCGSAISNSVNTIQTSLPPATPGTITGLAKPCPGDNGIAYSVFPVTNASGYNWVMPNGATISAGAGTNAITVNFAPTFVSGTLSVSAINACGAGSARNKSVSKNIPGTPGVISGLTFGLCGTTTSYSISAVSTATTYQWTAPAGITINNGQGTTSINITTSTGFTSGTLSVKAGTTCGYGAARNLTVKGTPAIPVSISGPITTCANQQNVGYSIFAISSAISYSWSVPSGASVTSGQGTTSIIMGFGAAGGIVKVRAVNACGAGSYKNLTVTINCRKEIPDAENTFDVMVYPNPSKNYFTIEVRSANGNNKLILRDLIGRQVARYENLTTGDRFEFGYSLPDGIYTAEILDKTKSKIIKLVKNE